MYPAALILCNFIGTVYPELASGHSCTIYLCSSIQHMRKILVLALATVSFIISKSQSITGNWEGALQVQRTELPAIFHISQDSTGKLTATFDSPKQMAYGLPCSKISIIGDSVVIEMKGFSAQYAGLLQADNKTITGNWSQGGMSLPLDLKKTNDVATKKEIKRPQTPKPPYPYSSEEVIYHNADKSIQFGATFTFPKHQPAKKYPAVILITGSGQQDRDETLFEHKPFAVIADYLTKQGIAVLRVDDRGKGKTTGDIKNATTADFAKDVEAAIEYIRSRPEVDITNLGLIGHSEGGMIAPMVASKRKDIKFIVLLAGPGVPIIDLMEQQSADVMLSSGVSKNDVEQFRLLYKNILTAAINENDSATAAKKITSLFTYWQNKTTTATVKNTTGVTDEKSRDNFVAAIISEVKQPWFNYFIQFKPADYLSKLHCAVLALNGEKDIQVAAAPNLEAIRKTMVEKMVKTFKVKALPGLNHLFQQCNTCTAFEYAELEETFSPQALQIIGDWIKEVTVK